MARLIKVDKNGTKYYEGYRPCSRCDGKGIYIIGVCNGRPVPSPVDSGVCFKCGGSGKEWGKWKEYTPEYEAKLMERRRKKAEKEAEQARAEREAREKEEAERLRQQEERIRAEKAKSQYIGKVGERIEIEVTLEKIATYERPSFRGYGTELALIYIFKQGDNKIVWNTSTALGRWNERDEWEPVEEGNTITLRGTVKDHSEYKEEKQTVLTRCKLM